MKRTGSILVLIALLFSLSACVEKPEVRQKEFTTEFGEKITIEFSMVDSLYDPLIKYVFSSNRLKDGVFFYEKNAYQKLDFDTVMKSELMSVGMNEGVRIYEFRKRYICICNNKWVIIPVDYSLNDYISDKKQKDVNDINQISTVIVSIAKIGRVDMIQRFSDVLIYQCDPAVTELANRWKQGIFTDAEIKINQKNDLDLDDLSSWAEHYLSCFC